MGPVTMGNYVDIALKMKAKNGVLQAFIDEKGWSQSDFARVLGASESRVGAWFNMKQYPGSPEMMLKVIALVGKDASEIFPPPLMDKDWLSRDSKREWTLHAKFDLECLPIHHMTSLPSEDPGFDKSFLKEDINKLLDTMPERIKTLISMVFGLDGKGETTLKEAGEVFGLSVERTRQLVVKGLRMLKHPDRRYILASYVPEAKQKEKTEDEDK